MITNESIKDIQKLNNYYKSMTEKETLKYLTTKHNRLLLKIQIDTITTDKSHIYDVSIPNKDSYQVGWTSDKTKVILQ